MAPMSSMMASADKNIFSEVGAFLPASDNMPSANAMSVAAGTGVILSAVYMLWMVQRVYYGNVRHAENAALPDLLPREWAGVLPRIQGAIR